jgi:phage terminase large subunit
LKRLLDIPVPAVFEPLLAPARYKGIYGGRGSGKSHFFADRLIDDSIANPGLRTVCIREYQVSLEQSVKRLLEDKISEHKVSNQFRILNTHIETPGGGIIIFQGMQAHTAESIKSLEGYHRAWVEEAQNFSARSLKLLRPTIREKDSEIWFSWNPAKVTDPVDNFLRPTPPPDAIVVKANYQDNPFFPDVLRKER